MILDAFKLRGKTALVTGCNRGIGYAMAEALAEAGADIIGVSATLAPGYAASKGAIGQLTMAFSNEWAGRSVQVNAIAPGYISTDNTEAPRNDPDRSQSILDRIPAGRWGGDLKSKCKI